VANALFGVTLSLVSASGDGMTATFENSQLIWRTQGHLVMKPGAIDLVWILIVCGSLMLFGVVIVSSTG
jgi:hypothetical protein